MEGESDYEGVSPAVEESAACEKTALEMENLPNEMLKSILEDLVVVDPERPYRWSQESWSSNFRSVAAYRQVCSPWRDFLDEILEKSLLSTVRAWCPPFHAWDSNPTPLSKVQIFYPQTIGLEEDEISCPPSLIDYNGSNPFPGKGMEVRLKYDCHRADDDVELRTQTTIRLMDLFTKVGHHLSFFNLNDSLIVDLDVLVSILERCPNLKALAIKDLRVSKDKSPRSPPPLPQLKTLRIDSVLTGPTIKSRFRLIPSFCQWLVEPYSRQLIQLENDFQAPVTAPLPNLKQFTLTFPYLSALQQNGPAVSLLRLCVNIRDGYCWDGDIYDVFCYGDKFSKTLVDLFLNVHWIHLIPCESDDDEVEEDKEAAQQQQQDPFMEELQRNYGTLPTSKVKFPHLKKFAFPYPKCKMQVMVFSQTVLPKFPALEKLLLIHFWDPINTSDDYERQRETIAKFLERENYWTICRKLQKITVLEDDDPDDDALAFTCSRSVST